MINAGPSHSSWQASVKVCASAFLDLKLWRALFLNCLQSCEPKQELSNAIEQYNSHKTCIGMQ